MSFFLAEGVLFDDIVGKFKSKSFLLSLPILPHPASAHLPSPIQQKVAPYKKPFTAPEPFPISRLKHAVCKP